MAGKGKGKGEGEKGEGWQLGKGGRSPFEKGDSRGKRGSGTGGPGQGEGTRPKAPDDVGLEKTKVKGQFGPGSATTLGFFKGDPSQASPSAGYGEMYNAYQEDANDALTKEDIPLGQKEVVKEYFESIRPKQK